jgi:hypothetical protein
VPDYTVKQGDTLPPLRGSLYDADGTLVDLAGATVTFTMGAQPGTPTVAAAATIVDAANGVVEYNWVAADTAIAGNFFGEFQVVFANGSIETFPNDTYIAILVKAELGT